MDRSQQGGGAPSGVEYVYPAKLCALFFQKNMVDSRFLRYLKLSYCCVCEKTVFVRQTSDLEEVKAKSNIPDGDGLYPIHIVSQEPVVEHLRYCLTNEFYPDINIETRNEQKQTHS